MNNGGLTLAGILLTVILTGCGGSSDTTDTSIVTQETSADTTADTGTDTATPAFLHDAYGEFEQDNVTVVLDGSDVVIESNGMPNHTSPYWSPTHELFSEPFVTSYEQMAPGYIDDFNGMYTLTVPAVPELASSSSATGLGAIGIAVSGAMIYNDEEGPGIPLDDAAGSLDYNGAHTGPQSYHYHLEPIAWSDDDINLIGVMADGFFLYGRKCNSTGDYPTDLDASGGHSSITQHAMDPEYHYHIQNELYINAYYILFPGDYQGTANAVR
jgi:hypothetical protein